MTRRDASSEFLFQLKVVGLPEPETEYTFAKPRRFRFDFAWLDRKLAVELEGGIYTRQAHGSITGILRDIEKYNLASLLGYTVLRITPGMVKSGEALTLIENAYNLTRCPSCGNIIGDDSALQMIEEECLK